MFSESKIYRLLLSTYWIFVVSFYCYQLALCDDDFSFFVYVTTPRIHFIRNLKYTWCVIKCDQMRNCSKNILFDIGGNTSFFLKSGYKLKCLGLSMDPGNKWSNQRQQTNTCRIMTIKIPSPTRLGEQGIM